MNRGHRPHNGVRRPNIGITPDFAERATADGTTKSAYYDLKASYADAVIRAGGLPFVLPYSDDRSVIEAYLERVSAIIVTGGAFDIPPEAYGDTAREGCGPLKPGRTAFETILMQEALKRNMPVLGVCGGMQLLNVVMGGTLHQDIGREITNSREHEQKHDRTQPAHPIDVKEGTLLAEHLGRGQIMVNSTHHQAVKTPGEKVTVSAVSPDGVVEAIEGQGYSFVVGVQWHPELLIQTLPLHLGLYRGLVHKARENRR